MPKIKGLIGFKKGLIGLAIAIVVAVLIGAMGVLAASPTPSSTPAPNVGAQGYYNQFISKLATALGKNENDTRALVAQAEKGVVADALQAGKINQQQADAIDKRIDQGGFVLPGGGAFFQGRPAQGSSAPRPFGGSRSGGSAMPNPGGVMVPGFMMMGNQGVFKAAAGYLGMNQQDLTTELRQGKSLADVVGEKASAGLTVDGLKSAITTTVKSSLDQAVANGKLTQSNESTMLQKLSSQLDNLINRKFQAPAARPTPRPTPQSWMPHVRVQG